MYCHDNVVTHKDIQPTVGSVNNSYDDVNNIEVYEYTDVFDDDELFDDFDFETSDFIQRMDALSMEA